MSLQLSQLSTWIARAIHGKRASQGRPDRRSDDRVDVEYEQTMRGKWADTVCATGVNS